VEVFDEGLCAFGGAFDADDASELAGEAGHAAFEPVAAVGGDDIGE